LLLAIKLATAGLEVFLTTGLEEAYPLLPGQTQLKLPPSSKLSILPFGSLLGLSLQGVKWPLKDAEVPLGSTWTLSNMALGTVAIGLREGYGVAVAYPATL
jgi:thiamine pyrophosphokinase